MSLSDGLATVGCAYLSITAEARPSSDTSLVMSDLHISIMPTS